MRETRLSGSVEGVVSNHDPYSDSRSAPVSRQLCRGPTGHHFPSL